MAHTSCKFKFRHQDAKQRPFRRAGRHEHQLELRPDRDRDYCGRVVYVVARCGVQGVIYPVRTDVQAKGELEISSSSDLYSSAKRVKPHISKKNNNEKGCLRLALIKSISLRLGAPINK